MEEIIRIADILCENYENLKRTWLLNEKVEGEENQMKNYEKMIELLENKKTEEYEELLNRLGLEHGVFDSLVKLVDDYVPPKHKTIYEMEEGDKYYYLDCDGDIIDTSYIDKLDISIINQGNAFLTKEEAEFEVERRRIYQIVKRYAHEFSKEEWEDDQIKKWCPYYNHETGITYADYNVILQRSQLHFKSQDDINHAIEEVGEDNFKRYYLGVK